MQQYWRLLQAGIVVFQKHFSRTAFTLTWTTGLSYVLGLVRDRVLAYRYGAGSILDTYSSSFVVPDIILSVFVGSALSAAFIPIFTKERIQNKKASEAYLGNVLGLVLVVISGLIVVTYFALPWLAEYTVPGFSTEQKDEYVLLTRMLLLSALLFAVSNLLGNVLISTRRYLWYGLSPVVYNLGIILGALFLAPMFGIMGIVAGAIVGAALHLSLRLPAVLNLGFSLRPRTGFDASIRRTIYLMLPRILQIGLWHLLLWWFVRLASQQQEGAVTVYTFARNFQSMPVTLVGIALALAAFSRLSELAAEQQWEKFSGFLQKKTVQILAITTLSALALAFLAPHLIGILLGGGAFDEAAVEITAMLLVIFCLSIPLESLMHLLARAHYALQNTLLPAMIHAVTVAIVIFTSRELVGWIGLKAIPVAYSAGLLFQILALRFSIMTLVRSRKRSITT